MNEVYDIVKSIEESDEPTVLATVVDVVGSAYRRPTARMLIRRDGSHVGSISGGCLERDLCRVAFDLTKSQPKLISFDTRQDSTNLNPRYNLGCSGIIYVLVERVTRNQRCPVRFLKQVVESGRPETTATIYQTESPTIGCVGDRFTADEMPFADSCHQLQRTWEEVHSTGQPTCCELHMSEGSVRMLIERISPRRPLWIFGAGEDSRPLAAMAQQLGWAVTVVDHEARRLTKTRFPYARRICAQWRDAVDSLHATADAVAVLMTHSFDADRQLLAQLVPLDMSYIGVLGPKSRTGKVLRRLQADGKLPQVEQLECLRTPIGLDLGASTAGEIAVAILGEIIALENGREGGSLGKRDGPIHCPVRHVLVDLAQRSSAVFSSD